MRRIISKRQSDRNKQILLGAVLILVMLGSVFGIVVNSFGKKDDKKRIIYNGFEFIEQNDFWFTSKGNLGFVFRYNPEQVEKIDSNVKKLDAYYGKTLYIYSENREAELEIYGNLHPSINPIVQRIQSACLKNINATGNVSSENISSIENVYLENCDENAPIRTCENNFIIIKEDNNTQITQSDGCVFIYGRQENLTMITDEFLFKILGIRE